jgi:hypothetical protein
MQLVNTKLDNLDASEFLDLDLDDRMIFLLTKYGLPKEFVFDGSITTISGNELRHMYTDQSETDWSDSIRGEIYELIYGSFQEHQYSLMAMLMQFFSIKSFSLGRIPINEHFKEFRRVFPFGCFSRDLDSVVYPFPEDRDSSAQEWAFGVIGYNCINECIAEAFTDDEFEFICSKLQEEKYTTTSVQKMLRAIVYCFNLPRTARMLEILSQKYLVVESPKPPLTPYAYLLKGYETSRMIPNPRWSRSAHHQVGFPQFTQEVRTIILMQKFRRDEFPLHKDLIDMLILKVFESHLEFFEADLQ